MLLRLPIRFSQKFLLSLGALLLLGVAIPSPALGQAHSPLRTVIKFTREVHWGGAVLQPGDYIVSVSSDASPTVTVGDRNGTIVATIAPKAVSARPLSGNFQVATIDDEYGRNYVTSVYLEDTGAVLAFGAPNMPSQAAGPNAEAVAAQEAVSGESKLTESSLFVIRNPRNQALPFAEAQAIYLSACKVVEQEFGQTDPVRPSLTLLLGSDVERLDYPKREIQLKKWDKYQFAEGVVMLGMYDLLPKDKKLSLARLAVLEAESTVDVSELKNSRSLVQARPRN